MSSELPQTAGFHPRSSAFIRGCLKILLMPVGSAGDVHPFVGLGVALKQRGHEVTLATNGHFRGLVERAGLTFVELGTAEQFRQVMEDPALWKPDLRATRLVFGMAAQLLRQQYELCTSQSWSVVVTGLLAFGARVAQDTQGLKVATVQLAPVFLSAEKPPRFAGLPLPSWYPLWLRRGLLNLAEAMVDRVAAGPINAFGRELGLEPVKHLAGSWWYSPRCVLTMFPDWYAEPASDWPANVAQVGFPLFDERGLTAMDRSVREFIDAGDPPIAFTAGSANTQAGAFFAASLAACEKLGRRAILLTRHSDQLPKLASHPGAGARALHVPYAPFSELLPGVDAFVHHGGIGSVAQALAAGVPQLVMPLSHDQFENAKRVRMLGCGNELRGRRYTADRAAAKLEQLLHDPRYREHCRNVAGRIERGAGIARACDVVERLAYNGADEQVTF